MQDQEVATCCRLSRMLSRGGAKGPGLSQVRLDTLFVRDSDFLYELAQEFAGEFGKVSSHWLELKRYNTQVDRENGELRRLRADCVVIACDVVDVMSGLERRHRERWYYFEKMIKKQTLRKIIRGTVVPQRGVARASISWCAGRIVAEIGPERLEKLLTLRSRLA